MNLEQLAKFTKEAGVFIDIPTWHAICASLSPIDRSDLISFLLGLAVADGKERFKTTAELFLISVNGNHPKTMDTLARAFIAEERKHQQTEIFQGEETINSAKIKIAKLDGLVKELGLEVRQ